MSGTNTEQWDLEKIKRYDDSWWLMYLKENTVFDTEGIKAQKDWLIEQAERVWELEGFTGKYVSLLKCFWKENNRLEKQQTESNRVISVMDDNLVSVGREIIDKENERAELQWQINRMRAVLETIMQMEQPRKRSATGKHNDILLIKRLAKDALSELE